MSHHPRLAVIGGGNRGATYARIAHGLGAQIVAIADPRPQIRQTFADTYGARPWADWRDLLAEGKLADAVLVCSPDREHVEPAIAAVEQGYHILLEKPMATDNIGATRVLEAINRAGVISALCHVLRYTAYTRELKQLLATGAIGQVAAIEHLEPTGWWHFAHSFVRGNWRSEIESSPFLLGKSVHDMDWLAYVMDEPVRQISSFGSLAEFRPENKPVGATERCLDCPVAANCPYCAQRIYHGFLGDPLYQAWPLSVVTPVFTAQALDEALRTGPYGECVYNGQNDVVDHQAVNMVYASGATASFVTLAFTEMANRKTRIFGSRGWLEGDGSTITLHDFNTNTYRTIDTNASDASAAGGHGGGDEGLVKAFLTALETGDRSSILSDAQASYDSLQLIWAAEQARRQGIVVTL